jgi:hypothetical protein
MSHNKITVDNQAPNSTGDVPVNMSSYISESSPSSPSASQVIKYDGANWVNSISPSGVGLDLAAGWLHYGGSYVVGGYYYRVNHYHINRKATGTARVYTDNTLLVNATSANTPLTSNNTSWFESIRLNNAGTYLCMYSMNCPSGTSIEYQWEDNSSNTFSNKVTLSNTNNAWGAICCGIITTTAANDRVRVVCQAYSGNVGISPHEEARNSSMTIIKLL